MTTHIFLLLVAGLAFMGTFMLPSLLRNRLLSLPIIFVAFGFLVFNLPVDLPFIDPEDQSIDRKWMEYVTEFIVIISLAGTGIKIKRGPGAQAWSTGWYLLGIAMPLTILSISLLGWTFLGLAPAAAVLLGAVLAPTDPVLAANVQVGPPGDNSAEDEVRFGLTLEAGLNDGLAFPFVYLAIALVAAENWSAALVEWLWWDLAYRVVVGVVCGYVLGKLLEWTFGKFRISLEKERHETELEEGFFVLASTLITYSLTEIAEGYGFLAVFIAAVISTQGNKYLNQESTEESYKAIDQVEQAILGVFLIAFGGILATGGLADLTWTGTAIGLAVLLIIRPLSGLISLIPSGLPWVEKVAISFFGIRGVGSLYYLAYGHNSEAFPAIDSIWAIVNFTMLVSIFLHGLSVKPLLGWVDGKMGRETEVS